MSSSARHLLASGLALGLIALAAADRQWLVDSYYRARAVDRPLTELESPGPAAVQVAAFQHPLAAADLFWLGMVQEIGVAVAGGTPSYQMLRRWAHIATDLDRRYLTIYYAVAVNLTVYARDADASDELLVKGMTNIPDTWQLPFLLGYNAYFMHGDSEGAARHWLKAAESPRHPRFLVALAARAKYQAGDQFGAVALLEEMIPHMEGPAREDAELRLKAFRSEPILIAYDEACRRYREAHGALPPDAATLRAEGLVDLPPEDLYGAAIELDGDCRARTKYIKVREDEAAQRVGDGGAAGSEAEVYIQDP